MRTSDRLYDLLQDKTNNQIFYNQMMIGMVNPVAKELFRSLRDDDAKDVDTVRRHFLSLEAKPLIFRSFITGKISPVSPAHRMKANPDRHPYLFSV